MNRIIDFDICDFKFFRRLGKNILFKMNKTQLKKSVNRKLFEDFIRNNSKYFQESKRVNGKELYVSIGGSIRLIYEGENKNFILRILLTKVKKIKTKKLLFFTKIKDELEELSYLKEASIKGEHKINPIDSNLYLEVKKIKSISESLIKTFKEEFTNEIRLKEDKNKAEILKNKLLLKQNISDVLKELDKDNNGVIDLIEDDPFKKLLQKHQKTIISIDKLFVQHFIKISVFLNDKRNNIQSSFENLKRVTNLNELNTFVKILQNQKHTYNLLLFHSLSMITSLIRENQDMITFYEIYEHFDKLKIFKTDHEKEISTELKQLNFQTSQVIEKLGELLSKINDFENSLVDSLNELSYTTEDGFSNLKESVSLELNSINSSLDVNNFLTGIQTYQMYKINKNTRSLRS